MRQERATRKCPFYRALSSREAEKHGAPKGREGERLSRVGPSAKAATTDSAQSRARLYRTSLSDSPGRKVAGARNAQDRKPSANPKPWPTTLDHCGSNRLSNVVGCGGHQALAWSGARGRLRCRENHQSSGPSSEAGSSRAREKLWAGLKTVNQGCNSGIERMNGPSALASTAAPLQRHRSSWCYRHLVFSNHSTTGVRQIEARSPVTRQ